MLIFILSEGFSFSNCLAQVHSRNLLDAECPFLLLALKRLMDTKLLAGSCTIIYFTQQSVLHNKIYNIKDSKNVLFKKESVNPLHAWKKHSCPVCIFHMLECLLFNSILGFKRKLTTEISQTYLFCKYL